MRRKTKNILYALLFVFGGVVYAMVGQPGDQPGLLDDTRVWASDCGPVLRAFREDPAHTAEMLPTWPAVGRYIASRVPRDARTILEVGTANGSVSRQLFQALLDNPVSEQTIEYDGVEISRLLFDDLERAHGHRKGAGVRFHHSPIEQWDKPDHIEQYDVIVSTLPKTQLPQPVLAEI